MVDHSPQKARFQKESGTAGLMQALPRVTDSVLSHASSRKDTAGERNKDTVRKRGMWRVLKRRVILGKHT